MWIEGLKNFCEQSLPITCRDARYAATCVCIESPDDDEGDMWHEGSQLGAQTYMTRDIITLSLMREVVSDERGNIHRAETG